MNGRDPASRAPASAEAETGRQALHLAVGGFALLLRWLSWLQALGLAAFAALFNLLVLPRFAARLYRPGDRTRAAHGIVFYPIAVLILIAAFPRRPDIAAAAWAILAVGDGIATLAGRAMGRRHWPWNPEKTIAGSVAFVIGGSAAGCALAAWCRPAAAPAVPAAFAFVVPPVAALVAALVETMPVRLDDNLSVPASAAAVLWLGALVSERYAGPAPGSLAGHGAAAVPAGGVAAAFASNIAVAVAGYVARTVSGAGAICGALIGITIFVALGWRGWALLLATFVAASAASRTGRARKERLGIAEDRSGRRGPGNAIANTGAAAIAAALAALDVHPAAARLAFVTALVAGGSDTVASEIGKAYGRRTVSVLTFQPVPPGTSGGMSVEGTLAGGLAAIALGGAATALALLPPSALVIVVAAATLGALVESWLGATLEQPGILNNDLLNFINTAVASFAAIGLASWTW